MNRQLRSSETSVLAVASEAGSGKALAPVLQVLCERGAKVHALLAKSAVDFIGRMWAGKPLEQATTEVRGHSV